MSDTCDIDGCDNDVNTVSETYDENDELIAEKSFCKEHIKLLIFGETDE